MPCKLIYHLYNIYFSMAMSKNQGIEKDDNNKDKQYQKRKDMIFSFFRKLRKIEFWTYIAYVIVLTICFQSVIVKVLTLLTHLWFNQYILSLRGELPMLLMDWNLWQIENLLLGLTKTFVEQILVSYLWPFWLKSKLQFCKKIIQVSCFVKVCYFWSFRM